MIEKKNNDVDGMNSNNKQSIAISQTLSIPQQG